MEKRVRFGEEIASTEVIKRTRGRLPHWEAPDSTVFLTFRLGDSLPKSVVDRYIADRRFLKSQMAADPENVELRKEAARLFTNSIDRALDTGPGCCYLAKPGVAEEVMDCLLHFDGERYDLLAASVMPNHVHLVATLIPPATLPSVTHSWKSFLAHKYGDDPRAPKPFFQSESYDHMVRNWRELYAFVRYTLDNPSKAKLANWPHVYDSGILAHYPGNMP